MRAYSAPAPFGAAPATQPAAGAEPYGDKLPRPVLAFLEQLRRLPLGAWVQVARRADVRGHALPAGSAPGSPETDRWRLRRAVDGTPGITARTRQRVHDLVAVAQGFVHPADLMAMKKVALTAALALVARPTLAEDEFARLYAPFADLVPLEALAADEARLEAQPESA